MAFVEKTKEFLDRGVEISCSAISKVGNTVQKLGDKTSMMLEINQLRAKRAKAIINLGQVCYNVLSQNQSVNIDNTQAMSIVTAVQSFDADIKKKEDALLEMKAQEAKEKEEQRVKRNAFKIKPVKQEESPEEPPVTVGEVQD